MFDLLNYRKSSIKRELDLTFADSQSLHGLRRCQMSTTSASQAGAQQRHQQASPWHTQADQIGSVSAADGRQEHERADSWTADQIRGLDRVAHK